MKKVYSNPEIKFVFLDSSDLICTSGGGFEGIGGDGGDEAVGARRRNSIWDDEE